MIRSSHFKIKIKIYYPKQIYNFYHANKGFGSVGKVRSLYLISSGSISAANGLLLVGCCVRDLRGTQVRALTGTSVVLVSPISHMVYTNSGGIIQP